MDFTAMSLALRSLCAYRTILEQSVMTCAMGLLRALEHGQGEAALELYRDQFYELRNQGYSGLGTWLWDWLRYTETPYGRMIESGGEDWDLTQAARRDVEALISLANLDCVWYLERISTCFSWEYASFFDGLPQWDSTVPFDFEQLTQFYQEMGCGVYARYRTFLWENQSLIPVPHPDAPHPEELWGYHHQRHQVWANTRLLIQGKPANNILLFGDAGTGKSATIKSMLHLPEMERLSIIEVPCGQLAGIHQLMRTLSGRRQVFILFLDNLSFDWEDATYSDLKTLLEGGLEHQPANVAIYATSNCHQLVHPPLSEALSEGFEVSEIVTEHSAFTNRFGLRIPYAPMSQKEYLDLVDHLARQQGLDDVPELHTKALEWELEHASCTPRVAQQFLASLGVISSL